MKKILLLSTILAMSAVAYSKEVVPQATTGKEVLPAPMVVVAETVVLPAPYLTLRFGGDIAPRYSRADLGFNPGFAGEPGVAEFLESHSGLFGKSLNEKKGKGFGWEVAAEYMYPVTQVDGLELGLGVAFQRHAKLRSVEHRFAENLQNLGDVHFENFPELPEDLGDIVLNINTEREIPNYDSLPLYVVGKYKFNNWDLWGAKMFVKGDFGWSYNMERGDAKSRTYVGLSNLPEGAPITDIGGYVAMDGSAKVTNGIYWGAGLGLEYDNWTVDLMYKMNTAKVKGEYRLPVGGGTNLGSLNNEVSNFSDTLNYSRVTLSLGYKF